jgi:hypothetical protein
MRILYIDHDKDDRDLFCEVVQSLLPTAQLHCVSSCVDALADFNDHFEPDVIFIDAYFAWVKDNECFMTLVERAGGSKLINYTGIVSPPRDYFSIRNFKYMPKPQSYSQIVDYLKQELVGFTRPSYGEENGASVS